MKALDYFYEEILHPVCESIEECLVIAVTKISNWIILCFLWLTVPVWIVPYLILRNRRTSHE